jgi:hypothetical protein
LFQQLHDSENQPDLSSINDLVVAMVVARTHACVTHSLVVAMRIPNQLV